MRRRVTRTATSRREREQGNRPGNPKIAVAPFGFPSDIPCYNSIYDCQSELFKRLPCNLTKTLDAMKTAIIKEKRRRMTENRENDSGGKK